MNPIFTPELPALVTRIAQAFMVAGMMTFFLIVWAKQDRPTRKRLLLTVVVIVVAVSVKLLAAPDQARVIIRNPCAGQDVYDWLYWFNSCWSF